MIVLARELSIVEIRKVADWRTPVEVFAHGAVSPIPVNA
jgi:collagenase-like PrtC family protease